MSKLILNSIPSDGKEIKDPDIFDRILFKITVYYEIRYLNTIMEGLKNG